MPRSPVFTNLPAVETAPTYLNILQVDALTQAFQRQFDEAKTPGRRRSRGRYWLAYLVLRHTGARLGEVLQLDASVDVDRRSADIRLPTLKRRKPMRRLVPVPPPVITELFAFIGEYPQHRKDIFQLDPSNFRKYFLGCTKEAGIPREASHPHVLRHTRAVEMLRSGVPATIVQDLLGHASLNTTAIYLRFTNSEAKSILKDKGLI